MKQFKGVRISKSKAEKISYLIKPYADKNVSRRQTPYSIQTLYTYVEDGFILGINNILLPRKVKYKPRKRRKEEVMFNRDYLNGRIYEFFLEFITNNPY